MDNREVFYGMFDRVPLISNNTPFEIKIYEGYGGVFRDRSSIPAGGKYLLLKLGLGPSTREYECRSSLDKFESVVYATASDEDLNEVAEIRFIYQTQDNILTFDVIPRGLSKEDLAIVKPVKDRVSSKIGEASRSSIKLRKLCNTVKLCRNQCDHLVEAYEKGIQKMMQPYSRVAEDPPPLIARSFNLASIEDGSFFAAIALHFFRPHRKMLSDIIIKEVQDL